MSLQISLETRNTDACSRQIKIRTLFIAALLVGTLVAPVYAAGQRTNGLITYTQLNADGSTSNVFIANPDGSNPQQVLLGNPAETFGVPIWSPDGTELLISHTIRCDNLGNCLFQPATVNPDGSNFNQLVPPNPPDASSDGMDCNAWYPGGKRILCGFSANPNAGVFSINASDGEEAVRLTTNPFSAAGGMDTPADVSPDGKQFLFVREQTKRRPTDPTPDTQPALFIENTDGTGLRQLTASGKETFGLRPAAHFSPDGTQIIGEIGNGKLFTIRPDGSHFAAIDLQVTGRYFAFWPGWSPDGSRIIFCILFFNGGEGIYTANPDGANVQQITFTMNLGPNFANLFNGPNWGTHPVQ
jgi:Tol biopolymer transport system component